MSEDMDLMIKMLEVLKAVEQGFRIHGNQLSRKQESILQAFRDVIYRAEHV